MTLTYALLLLAVGIAVVLWIRRKKSQFQLQEHSIGPEELHKLLASGRNVPIYDVRQPLDLLAHSDIIPGARRIPPEEILDDPSLLPQKDESFVVYCTCPGDKTSRTVLHKALAFGFTKVRFLKGGLSGWKALGYPIEQYDKPFHLNSVRS
jgi:rhodanese-related sulfurtransferase